jgi:hypothetical protein
VFKQPHYTISLLLSLALAIAAVITLIPDGGQSNRFGYPSVCSFAPWSTLALAALAAANCAIRKRLYRYGGGSLATAR